MDQPKIQIDNLKFDGLTFSFDTGAKLFQKTTFDFPMDQIAWIKAESGAGRSTLLQLLAGLLIPEEGSYIINGEDVSQMSFEEYLPYRLNIGYGFDLGGLLHNKTLLENLTLPLLYHKVLSSSASFERAVQYMEELGIAKYQDLRPSVVPGGVRKLTCLIRALILHPQVLLLDDPSVGLGQETALKYFDLVDDLRKAGEIRHVYMSSFDEKLMSVIDHTTIVIDEGQLYHFEPEGFKKVVHL